MVANQVLMFIDKRLIMNYPNRVSCGSGTPQAANDRKSAKLVDLGSVRFKVNALPIKLLLVASRQNLVPRAFLRSQFAVCSYLRDNQRNEASGSAIRRCAGGNSVRIVELAREYVRLFDQSFKTNLETCASLQLPQRRSAPTAISVKASEPECLGGMSFAFRSSLTNGNQY
jgi:hypothetical protein